MLSFKKGGKREGSSAQELQRVNDPPDESKKPPVKYQIWYLMRVSLFLR
jgi:hypothetical protein